MLMWVSVLELVWALELVFEHPRILVEACGSDSLLQLGDMC